MDNMNSNMGSFNSQPNGYNYNTQNTNKSSKNGCLIALAAAGGTVIAIGIVILVAIIAIILAIGNAVGSVSSSITSSSDAVAVAAYDTDYVETLYFEGTIADNGMYSTGYNHQWTLDEIDRLIDDEYNKGLILYLLSLIHI